jgi:hypothetical protein
MSLEKDTEYDDCLQKLANWAKAKKDELYEANIKSPTNREAVLETFTRACRQVGQDLVTNLNAENDRNLRGLGWPDELMECMKQPDIRTILCDQVENWFIRFPFVKSRLHLEELERENSGLRK